MHRLSSALSQPQRQRPRDSVDTADRLERPSHIDRLTRRATSVSVAQRSPLCAAGVTWRRLLRCATSTFVGGKSRRFLCRQTHSVSPTELSSSAVPSLSTDRDAVPHCVIRRTRGSKSVVNDKCRQRSFRDGLLSQKLHPERPEGHTHRGSSHLFLSGLQKRIECGEDESSNTRSEINIRRNGKANCVGRRRSVFTAAVAKGGKGMWRRRQKGRRATETTQSAERRGNDMHRS